MTNNQYVRNDFPVLVAGGTGVFGSIICRRLARTVPIWIGARNPSNAETLCRDIEAQSPGARVKAISFDVMDDLSQVLATTEARLLINATGPFQNQDYRVPEQCIRSRVSYIDIADGRHYVSEIARLDEAARASGVLVITGASSVPGLSSAVIQGLAADLTVVQGIAIGITPGNHNPRGLSTVRSVLNYVGKPIPTRRDGKDTFVYGWQDLRVRTLKVPGRVPIRNRLFSACDVADLDLLPQHFPKVGSVQFHAGLEIKTLHLGLWILSWVVRAGLIDSLGPAAPWVQDIANWFLSAGTDRGGMFVEVIGRTQDGHREKRLWTLIAEQGSGVSIPAIPAVILARKLASGGLDLTGAMPCFGLFGFEDFASETSDLNIAFVTRFE